MNQCRQELSITTDYIASHETYVAEENGHVVGFYGMVLQDSHAHLELLYIEPDVLQRGYGRSLWRHAVSRARLLGAKHLSLDADPHAERFYEAMGAERIGEAPSGSIPGRNLPLLRFTIHENVDE